MEKVCIDSIYSLSNDYSGSFYSKELNTVYLIYQKENKLYCRINSNASEQLIISGTDSFRLKRDVIKMIRNDMNGVDMLEVNGSYSFTRIE
jgi:hypothetical protein